MSITSAFGKVNVLYGVLHIQRYPLSGIRNELSAPTLFSDESAIWWSDEEEPSRPGAGAVSSQDYELTVE